MTTTTLYTKHAALVDRMAGLHGIDLEELVLRGQMGAGVLCDLVLRCSGCENPEGCSAWMSTQLAPIENGPAICRNSDLFSLLKTGARV